MIMYTPVSSREARFKRKLRIRAVIVGTRDRPRLSVYRSNKRLSVQLIDDQKAATLVSIAQKGSTRQVGEQLGSLLAARAKKLNIVRVVFDRSGYRYHGVIASLADAAREGGLRF